MAVIEKWETKVKPLKWKVILNNGTEIIETDTIEVLINRYERSGVRNYIPCND